MADCGVVLQAAREMDRACRELAWWTKPVVPPEELMDEARRAIRRFRAAHNEFDGSVPLKPKAVDE